MNGPAGHQGEDGKLGEDIPLKRPCGTTENHRRMARLDPEYRARSRQIEAEVKEWVNRYGAQGLRIGVIRIPVVAHVVFHTPDENIPDSQIHSALDALNKDFRRLNTDAANTPADFVGFAADTRIEFALAVRDPDCNPTSGITRTETSVSGWTMNDQGMKSAALGGHDPWDVEKYLNFWIVSYSDGTGGFGTFPAVAAQYQGVTSHYPTVGANGWGRGRTLTHEVGHWLDLHHIWGDDGAACTGSDEVSDTPNQAGPSPFSGSCRVHPSPSCDNDGDMFMNYMDYSPGACLNMFTAGQATRMDAALHVARASILGSDGLVPPPAVSGSDLWMQDVADDTGVEPNPSPQPVHISNDIWVRTANDGVLNQAHQNPEYHPPGAGSNYVYVRVRNRGCSGTGTGTLKLYWAKASSGLSWPAPWDGSVTAPAQMGMEIGAQLVAVAAGEDEVYTFPWDPPNPDDYASFGADKSHFCLLARIETAPSSPFGMTFAETSNLIQNVRNNNKIVWKNIDVLGAGGGGGNRAQMIVANFGDGERRESLVFEPVEEAQGLSILHWGTVVVQLPPRLLELLDGEEMWGVEELGDGRFQILEPGARLGRFMTAPGDVHAIECAFAPNREEQALGVRVFELDVAQIEGEEMIGGVRFAFRASAKPAPPYRSENRFDGVSWLPAEPRRQSSPCC